MGNVIEKYEQINDDQKHLTKNICCWADVKISCLKTENHNFMKHKR